MIAAIIGGAASSVSGYMGNMVFNDAALAKMDVMEKLTMFGVMALFSGIFSATLYLKQSPLPGADK